jgi:hypothetical protein
MSLTTPLSVQKLQTALHESIGARAIGMKDGELHRELRSARC